MSDEGIQILPFYLVADASYSMSQDGKIDTLNQLLPQLRDELVRNPVVGDMVRFGLLDFSDEATVVMPLTDIRSVEVLPTITPRGGTSFVVAFKALKAQIDSDYRQLKADGYSIKRTTAVFLSDGTPTDDDASWRAAFAELTDYDAETHAGNRLFPNLIPVGIGDCDRTILSDVRYRKDGDAAMPALYMTDGGNPAKAIAELIPLLIRSIVNSSLAQADGGGDDQGAAAKAMASTLANADGFDVELD
jgi:uncharacterized protein YegL